jgi:hypothetical protein
MSWVSRYNRKLTWPICKFSFSNMDSQVDLQWGFFFFFLPEGSWIPNDKWTAIIYSQTSKTMQFSFVSLTYAHIIIVIRKVLGFLTLWCWETWVGKWQRACLINEQPKTCLFCFLWVPKKVRNFLLVSFLWIWVEFRLLIISIQHESQLWHHHLSMKKEGSLFCFVLFCSYKIHWTGMLQIVFLVLLESSQRREGCMGLVPWHLDLQCKSSWILNDFFNEN